MRRYMAAIIVAIPFVLLIGAKAIVITPINNDEQMIVKMPEIKLIKVPEIKLKEVTAAKNPTFSAADVTLKSNLNANDMKIALKGTSLASLAGAFIEAEDRYGINALFLASLVAHESAWGESERSKNGSNNLTGYAVYTESSNGKVFSSKAENIVMTAKLIANEYIDKDGMYYTGPAIRNINKRYCIGDDGNPDFGWSDSIINISNELLEKVG